MRWGRSAVRYAVVGIVGLFFSIGLYSWLVVSIPSLGIIWPAVITKLLWVPFAFASHSRWSFPSKKAGKNSEAFLRFGLSQVFFFLLTPSMLHVLHNLIGIGAIYSYTVALVFSIVLSFVVNVYLVFKPQDLTPERIGKANVPPESS